MLGLGLEWGDGGGEAGGLYTTRTVPSQELEQNVSFETRFQCTEKASRMCSFQD